MVIRRSSFPGRFEGGRGWLKSGWWWGEGWSSEGGVDWSEGLGGSFRFLLDLVGESDSEEDPESEAESEAESESESGSEAEDSESEVEEADSGSHSSSLANSPRFHVDHCKLQ